MGELLNENNSIGLTALKTAKKEVFDKWEKLGLLDGLVGTANDKFMELFQCCPTQKINSEDKENND